MLVSGEHEREREGEGERRGERERDRERETGRQTDRERGAVLLLAYNSSNYLGQVGVSGAPTA